MKYVLKALRESERERDEKWYELLVTNPEGTTWEMWA
jgi:hypothetical protein